MKLFCLLIAAVGLAQAQAEPPKVALVNIQDVILGTPDGQNAEKELDDRFGPVKNHIEDEQNAISTLQKRLEGPLNPEARRKLEAEVTERTLAVNKETDEAGVNLDQAQKKMLSEVGPKIVAAIASYAKDHGYVMVFDISTSDAPRLYAPNATDITGDVIASYGKEKP